MLNRSRQGVDDPDPKNYLSSKSVWYKDSSAFKVLPSITKYATYACFTLLVLLDPISLDNHMHFCPGKAG